ncbi:hypothetical protein K474DRAFT_210981 [Panus rudis PR-1116 ss-1]|nr:hypothetical protein K474DRAFT_210981 [Panus rudis PR-1116 ss-1]
MATVAATPNSTKSTPSSAQHQYGTRIRSNSVIKPSARLRQSPAPIHPPRRIKPAPTAKAKANATVPETPEVQLPSFPPPHVMLHQDDANSRVFLAIGRSFVSVNNCAMTIKDLAEMTMKFGLICQNVSAASQAITTYIRNHLQRCEVQQDHPLLLRHAMSGTASDDDLVPALHSRVGGAHCTVTVPEGRVTNFRRGTMVWYLSRAAGAPCPFARAGIQLSHYTENGKVGALVDPGKERKRERDRVRRAAQCGEKRKRLVRACTAKGADSESSDEDQPPPKVKLTLRLRPSHTSSASSDVRSAAELSPPADSSPEVIDLSQDTDSSGSEFDSDSDSMSVDSSDSEDDEEMAEPSSPQPSHPLDDSSHCSEAYSRLSPVPHSEASASPPPDSDEEDADFHLSLSGSPHIHSDGFYEEDDTDWNSEHDEHEESDTQWGESPGPRSPSVQFEAEEVVVKQEPRDVRGLLDAWEDFDISATDMKVLDVVAQAAAGIDTSGDHYQVPSFDSWTWEEFGRAETLPFGNLPIDEEPHVKQEDDEPRMDSDLFGSLDNICQSPLSPSSSSSAAASPLDAIPRPSVEQRRRSELLWKDAELLGPDSVKPHDLEASAWQSSTAARDAVSSQSPILRSPEPSIASEAVCGDTLTRADGHPDSSIAPEMPARSHSTVASSAAFSATPRTTTSSSGIELKLRPSLPPVKIAERDTRNRADSDYDEVVVVHTCQPCVPAICATEFEGVSVYQMTLGSHMILRRIDTDYVNISPILDFLGLPHPSVDIPHAVTVSQGSSVVCGSWVKVSAARELIRDQPLVGVFLSDDLAARFPPALHDFHRSNTQGRSLSQFGPSFRSTIEAKRESNSSFKIELPSREPGTPWDRCGASPWDVEDHLLSVHPPFALATAFQHAAPVSLPEDELPVETPLSPTEEEIFHSLCSAPEWEPSPASVCVPAAETADSDVNQDTRLPPPRNRPLRRSKRVADAAANRSRTRSSKRGSRSSLS